MVFRILEKTVQELMELCKSNQVEISGSMTFIKNGDSYYFRKYTLSNQNDIKKATHKQIKVTDSHIADILIQSIYNDPNSDLIVGFHTHPSYTALAYPSKTDAQFIKQLQQSINNVRAKATNADTNQKILYVECIITFSEIGFYYSDGEEIKRIPVFTERRELQPNVPRKGNIIEAFINGFHSGRHTK